ncbi:MAG: hypothetical protein WAW96_02755, partial [Alphaproteobacteria bacterium]
MASVADDAKIAVGMTPANVATAKSDQALYVADAPATDYPPLAQAYWALFIFALSLVVNFLD